MFSIYGTKWSNAEENGSIAPEFWGKINEKDKQFFHIPLLWLYIHFIFDLRCRSVFVEFPVSEDNTVCCEISSFCFWKVKEEIMRLIHLCLTRSFVCMILCTVNIDKDALIIFLDKINSEEFNHFINQNSCARCDTHSSLS